MNKIQLKGIVATGHSLNAAINNYTQIALGKGVTVQVDGNNNAFVARASDASTMFNPATGNMDLQAVESLLPRLSFKSVSSEVNSNAFHAHCSMGCGSHILADRKSMLNYCPLCTSSLSSDEVEEVSTEENTDDAEIVDQSDDQDIGDDEDQDADELVAADDDDNADEPIVVAGTSLSDALDLYRAKTVARGVSISADDQVNYVVCSSASCGAHIVHAQGITVSECPACLSATQDVDADPDTVIDISGSEPDADLTIEDAEGDEEQDAEDGEDADGDDVIADESDPVADEEIAAVASSFSAAQKLYASKKALVSTSTDHSPEYLVCSSADCGAHIIADKHLAKCPICKSSTEEPIVDGLGEDDTVTDAPVADETGSVSDDNIEIVQDDEEDMDDTSGDDDISASSVRIIRRSHSNMDEAEEMSDADETEDDTAESDGDKEEAGNALAITNDDGKELTQDKTEIDALSYVADDLPVEKLDVSFSAAIGEASAWTAFCNDVPVAMARVATAGKNADVFHTERFGQAVIATAKVAGVRKALNEMGFVGIKHQVSVSTEVAKMVDEKIAADKAAVETDKAEHADRLQQALSTAIIGLNRNFFAGKSNPLKSSLYSAMSSAGIANPEVIIDACFSKHHDTWLQGVFAQASEILAKPVEVQESLAKTIVETNYQPVSTSSVNTGLEARLSNIGTSVSSTPVQKPVAPAPVAPTRSDLHQRVLDGLGRSHL